MSNDYASNRKRKNGLFNNFVVSVFAGLSLFHRNRAYITLNKFEVNLDIRRELIFIQLLRYLTRSVKFVECACN